MLVTHNNLAELREVIRRVFSYTTAPFQVCIVDNASDDDTREFLRRIAVE